MGVHIPSNKVKAPTKEINKDIGGKINSSTSCHKIWIWYYPAQGKLISRRKWQPEEYDIEPFAVEKCKGVERNVIQITATSQWGWKIMWSSRQILWLILKNYFRAKSIKRVTLIPLLKSSLSRHSTRYKSNNNIAKEIIQIMINLEYDLCSFYLDSTYRCNRTKTIIAMMSRNG